MSVTFKGYVPLSEYKGTILKLTKKDKEEIAKLQKIINEYEADIYENKRNKSLKKKCTERDEFGFFIRHTKTGEKIDTLRNKISEIKKNRLQKQQEKAVRLSAIV